MLESNKEEERLARVEHTLEQLKKLQRDADAFKHHIAAKMHEVVVQVEPRSVATPSPAKPAPRKLGRCRL